MRLEDIEYAIVVLVVVIIGMVLLVDSARADVAFDKRMNRYGQQVREEVARAQELKLKQAEIEVLGRLEILKSTTINVNAISSSGSQSKSFSNAENSNS